MDIPHNVQTVMYDLPPDIHAYTVLEGAEDYYTVVLNAHDTHQRNMQALYHELRHILGRDFLKHDNINDIELAAHADD